MRRKAHATGPASPRSTTSTDGAASDKGADWAIEALDRLDSVIDKVRSNTTDRLVRIARGVVFGLLIAIMAIIAFVLVTIALIRLLNESLPGGVWIVYLMLGAIFSALGAFLWSLKTANQVES